MAPMWGWLSVASSRASRAKRDATLGVGREVRRQDFDRDVAPELAVARAIDLAHAAGAERRDDCVGPELTADHLASFWRPSKVACDDRRRCLEKLRRTGLIA